MPGLVPGIHALIASYKKDVDGRDKPGHDEVDEPSVAAMDKRQTCPTGW